MPEPIPGTVHDPPGQRTSPDFAGKKPATASGPADAHAAAPTARPVDGAADGPASEPLRAAIVYGSTYGRTEDAARMIAVRLMTLLDLSIELLDIGAIPVSRLADYDMLVVGISTWNVGELQADWDVVNDELSGLDLTGVQVATFGVGDQLCYPDTFLDALGLLAERFYDAGARLIGAWPVDGYEFDDSLALRDDRFVGLGLDYDNQEELNLERITRWCELLVDQLNLQPRPRARRDR